MRKYLFFHVLFAACLFVWARPAVAETRTVVISGTSAVRNAVTGEVTMISRKGTPVSVEPGEILQVLQCYWEPVRDDNGKRPFESHATYFGYPDRDQTLYYPYYIVPNDPPPTMQFAETDQTYLCNGAIYGIFLGSKEMVQWLKAATKDELASLCYVYIRSVEDPDSLSRLAGRQLVVSLDGDLREWHSRLKWLSLRGLAFHWNYSPFGIRLGDLPELRFFAYIGDRFSKLKQMTFEGDLSALESVSFWGCTKLSSVPGLSSLPNLKYFFVADGSALGDGSIATAGPLSGICMRDCPKLTTLAGLKLGAGTKFADFRFCKSLKDVSMLKTCTSARAILLSSSPQLADVSFLSELHGIEVLEISDCLGLSAIPDLDGNPNLTFLAVGGNRLKSLSFLADCPSLKHVELNNSPEIESLEELAGATQLQALVLSCCPKVRSLAPLAGLKDLESLDASRTGIVSLEGISNAIALTSLSLADCEALTDISQLESAPGIVVLDLSGSPNVSSLSPIRSLRALWRLSVSGSADKDYSPLGEAQTLFMLGMSKCPGLANLDFCSKLKALSSLDISDCADLADVSGLVGSTALEVLTIGNAPLLRSLQPLAGSASLRAIWLSKMPGLLEGEVEGLRKALPNCQVFLKEQ
ncbi:MAG: leucine-rich repeat domain-containing protein [Candidatus Brocadiia bacterium]